MLHKITTAEARKKFADIVNKVAYRKDSYVLTRRGEAMAAIVSMDDLKVLYDLEEKMDVDKDSDSDEEYDIEQKDKEADGEEDPSLDIAPDDEENYNS